MSEYTFDATTKPRALPATAIVLHWTAGGNPPAQVARTLAARRLSIHFIVGVGGEVVQMASLDRRCSHAGTPMNDRSIGIEVVSPGIVGDPNGKPAMQKAHRVYMREKAAGVERTVYTAHLRGRRVTILDYTTAQAAAVEQLVDDLCGELGVPKRVPVDGAGALLARQLTAAELEAFSGVIGHYHCHKSKLDPGTAPLDRLRVRWAVGG